MEVEEIDEDEPEVLEVDVPAAANDPADDDAEVLEVEVPAGTSQMQVEGLDDVDVPVAASDDGDLFVHEGTKGFTGDPNAFVYRVGLSE